MKGKQKMNEILNLENAKSETIKTDYQVLAERITKLEKAVFVEPTEANSAADEEAKIIINGNVDRKLYAKVCTLCLSEDGVNVIYKNGGKEKARACFQNEMKPIAVNEYLMETYDLSIRSANCLKKAYQISYGTTEASKEKLEKWLRTLLENSGLELAKVRNLGRVCFKEVMKKVGNAK